MADKLSTLAADKKIVVSFKSDSEDESNTSSSTSSSEDSSSSDEEKESTPKKKSVTSEATASDKKKVDTSNTVNEILNVNSALDKKESFNDKEVKILAKTSESLPEKIQEAADSSVRQTDKRSKEKKRDESVESIPDKTIKQSSPEKSKNESKKNEEKIKTSQVAEGSATAAASDDSDDLPDLSRSKKNSSKVSDHEIPDGLATRVLKDSKDHSKTVRKTDSEEVSSNIETNLSKISSNLESEKSTDSNKKESKRVSKSSVDVPLVHISNGDSIADSVADGISKPDDQKLAEPETKISKHRSKSPRETPTVTVSDGVNEAEDQSLVVPSGKVSKQRSKSPREASSIEVSNETSVPTPVAETVSQPEDHNLAVPSAKVSKRRSKSPRDAQVEDIPECAGIDKSSTKKKELMESLSDSVTESATSIKDSFTTEDNSDVKKTNKKSSRISAAEKEDDQTRVIEENTKAEKRAKKIEAEITNTLDITPEIIDESSPKPSKKKKKKSGDEAVEVDENKPIVLEEEAAVEECNLEIKTSKSSKKKSSKDKSADDQETEIEKLSNNENLAIQKEALKKCEKSDINEEPSNSDVKLTTTVADVEEITKTKKKSRKLVDESATTDTDSLSTSKETTHESNSASEEGLVSEDKPKKKKSSKSSASEISNRDDMESVERVTSDITKHNSADVDFMLDEEESGKMRSDATTVMSEKILLNNATSEKKSRKQKDIDEPSIEASEDAPQIVTKVLEEAIQEKCDIVVLNEIEELPNTEFSLKIVKPMSEVDMLLEEARLMTSGRTKDIDSERAFKDAALPSAELEGTLDIETNVASSSNVESATNVEKLKVSDDSEFSANNEESDLSSRRRSMDDFIKKILAEAREENQALKAAKDIVPDPSKSDKKAADSKKLTRTDDERVDDLLNASRTIKKGERFTEIDDDDDLDFARLRSNRRQPRKVFDDNQLDDSESPPSDGGSGRPQRNRYRGRGEADYLDDEELMSSSALGGGKFQPRHGGGQNDDDAPEGESFLAKFRRERDASHLPEDLFKPKRSDETADVVRDKTRNIRIMVDQQTDCTNTLTQTKRVLTEVDSEIKDLRQLSLDWRARIEALESSLDLEYRTYETDLQAASQRLHQQRMPDDRALREEFTRLQGDKLRRLDRRQDDFDVEAGRSPFARRRSGSVSSASNFGYPSDAGNGGMDSGTDRVGGAYSSGRMDGVESFLSTYGDRSRREGSLTRRDRYTVDMNSSTTSRGNEDDRYLASPARSGSARPVVDMSAYPSRSDAVMKIRAKYASLDETGEGYVTPVRLRSTPRDSAYGSLTSDYSLSDASKGYGSRRDLYSSATLPEYASFNPSRYSSGGSDSYGSLSYLPDRDITSSRQSKSYESASDYRSSLAEPSAADYQNKFLSRVRGSSAASLGTDARSGSQASTEEKPFKSRFLKSTTLA